MCGIFGLSFGPASGVNRERGIEIAKELFLLSESRGKEASGLAVVQKDKIVVLKRSYSAKTLVKQPVFRNAVTTNDSNSFTVVGHSRLVTNGASFYHENNQPVYTPKAIAVHNGIIVNADQLFNERPSLNRKAEVDSEYLVARLESLLVDHNPEDALKKLLSEVDGVTSTAFLLSDRPLMLLASNNGSLYYCYDNDKQTLIFASERYILQKLLERFDELGFLTDKIGQLEQDHFVAFNHRDGDIVFESGKVHMNGNAPAPGEPLAVTDLGPDNASPPAPPFSAHSPDPSLLQFPVDELMRQTRCTKCLLPESFPLIAFDRDRVCNYCREYIPIGPSLKGPERFKEDVWKFSKGGKPPKPFVALSGGRDSCYALHYVCKELGLKAVAYTYDWGMVTDLARRNMSRMCARLGVEHILVSADIAWKRRNIRKNVSAWLRKPDLGMVPLFMAGDKQFFHFAEVVSKQNNYDCQIFGQNLLERTDFKTGFCGIEKSKLRSSYRIALINQLKMLWYYSSRAIQNPAYLNSTVLDSLFGFFAFYVASHNHLRIFEYLPWDEEEIVRTLIDQYDWELAPDTTSTWRIGDGTASFYNYIYMLLAGFTESETFRSNQIREGQITRAQGMEMLVEENRPRFESIRWYLDTIELEFNDVIRSINAAPRYWLKR